MTDKQKRGDYYSGIPWVNVTAQQARDHPKGKLNAILWAIALYFFAVGALRIYFGIANGYGVQFALLSGIWPLLVGLGLAFRVPWAVVMACISAGLSMYALVRGLRGGADVFMLVETLISVGILFYLVDADRPNLIYRHRYRKYSALKEDKA